VSAAFSNPPPRVPRSPRDPFCYRTRSCGFPTAPTEETEEDPVRRALGAVGLVEIRLVAPEDEIDDIAGACLGEADQDSSRADEARDLWRNKILNRQVPSECESFDQFLGFEWFRDVARWLIGPLRVREAGSREAPH
jgi:hypothetical protein